MVRSRFFLCLLIFAWSLAAADTLKVRIEPGPKLMLSGVPGGKGALEWTEDLSKPWAIWTNVVIGAEGTLQLDLMANPTRRFYRIALFPVGPVGFEWIPPGTFVMGSPPNEPERDSDELQHTVTLSRGFWLSDHEVTQAEYEAVTGNNPSHFKGAPNRPVEQVSWNDAVLYCQRLTERERISGAITALQEYRLPTESEWEYAARALMTEARSGVLDAIAWWSGNSNGHSQPVRQKAPNAWGLYDMMGNLSEWCWDAYGAYPEVSVRDPRGSGSGSDRVFRGGGWGLDAGSARSANRDKSDPATVSMQLGFRPLLISVAPEKPSITTQPLGVSVTVDNDAQFNVAVDSSVPVTYQWQLNGQNLLGATQSRLVITRAQLADAGEYWVVVRNPGGSVISASARLSVIAEPTGFLWIAPGTFVMGSPLSEKGRKGDETQRSVTIQQGFWLSDHEVTQAEYTIIRVNPSWRRDDPKLPVDRVSWNDAQMYCEKLTELERAAGRLKVPEVYRLPTEAEWEYAARAGTITSRYGDLEAIAWNASNSEGRSHPVKLKVPNAWGLHDMIGNLWEWCSDVVGDPTDPAEVGSIRPIRGGAAWEETWYESVFDYDLSQTWDDRLRFANRELSGPGLASATLGFRPVRGLPLAPWIADQPSSLAATVGGGACFLVTAQGTAPLRYQWQFNGRDLAGAIQAALTITNLQAADAGEYRVVISNPWGSTPSASARLTVDAATPGGPLGFVWIPPGSSIDEMQSLVAPSQGFWLLDHEVTQGEYEAVMGANPSRYPGDSNRPVEQVILSDAVLYSQKLTERERLAGLITALQEYRLPTESEWVYAARAGTIGSRHGTLDTIAWWAGNSAKMPHPVKLKVPNAWGLHDMIGNVGEWCLEPSVIGPGELSETVSSQSRGGSFDSPPEAVLVTARDRWTYSAGFRPALCSILPPKIIAQPQSVTVLAGGAAWFTITVRGSKPMTCQWQFNGVDLPGATKLILAVNGLQATYAGAYRAVIGNRAGSVTSDVVRLTVNAPTAGGPAGFVWIPPGTFWMGDSSSRIGFFMYDTLHPVTLTRGFWLSDHEVTQVEYERVMGVNPSYFLGDPTRPVDQVDWNDAVLYCQRLTEQERMAGSITAQQAYRLPTEAEWEYAARAGTAESLDAILDDILNDIAWWSLWFHPGNAGGSSHSVQQKVPNAWGLYDMIGNVSEWCLDWHGSYPTESVTDPTGPKTGDARVVRGGSWASDVQSNFIARGFSNPVLRLKMRGFRPVLGPIP